MYYQMVYQVLQDGYQEMDIKRNTNVALEATHLEQVNCFRLVSGGEATGPAVTGTGQGTPVSDRNILLKRPPWKI